MAKRGRKRVHADNAAKAAAYKSRLVAKDAKRVNIWLSAIAHQHLTAAAAAWDCTISEAATRIFEEAGANDQAPGA